MKFISYVIVLLILFSCAVFAKAQDENVLPKEHDEKILAKADFLQSKLNIMMQDTASWLDNIGDDESEGASATGYLQLSWIPRTADLDDVDAKFKVLLNLPNWSEKLALVIDNNDEDELLLDYETDNTGTNQDGVNVAFQYIKQFNNDWQVKNRMGISRSQLYLRSEMQFNWQVQKMTFRIQPRIDYFLQDGWGPSVLGAASFQLEKSYLSLSASWQKIENESRSRRKIGFFHIKNFGLNQLLVSGVQYNKTNNKLDISNENYIISTRYRNLLYKSWMYFEVEPFVEFNQLNNFKREVGIALHLISYYGG